MPNHIQLKHWRKEHIPDLIVLANNKKIWEQLRDHFPHPYTRADAVIWINSQTDKKTDLQFAIEIDGSFVGAISIIPKEDIYRLTAEIGYWIGEPYWNKGIATKAVELALDFCRQRRPEIIRVYAEIFDFNKGSQRVLEKNGFQLESIRKKAIIKNGRVGDDHVWVKIFEAS